MAYYVITIDSSQLSLEARMKTHQQCACCSYYISCESVMRMATLTKHPSTHPTVLYADPSMIAVPFNTGASEHSSLSAQK